MAASPPPADLSAYTPPPSLWQLVESSVPHHEQEEMKNMLGGSLVEQSLELHDEIETLLEIWRDYRDETNHVNLANIPNRLPEPPAVRDRLRREISFFVNRIREKSSEMGSSSNAEHILAKHNSTVLEYVMEQKRPDSNGYYSRPSSIMSSTDGRETPLYRLGTPTSDRFSQSSILSEEMESMSDKLNILKMDEVTAHLRETLEGEIEYLLTDISFLQGCLEEEADFRSQSSMSMEEPTLSELRDERNKLEKDLLEGDSSLHVQREKTSSPHKHVDAFQMSAYSQVPSARSRVPISSPGSTGRLRSRPGPVKASHDISASHASKPRVPQTALREGQREYHIRPPRGEKTSAAEANNTVTTRLVTRTGSSGSLPRGSRLVKVGSVPVHPGSPIRDDVSSVPACPVPVPPSEGRQGPQRPSSADRFRKMVLVCRENDEIPPVS